MKKDEEVKNPTHRVSQPEEEPETIVAAGQRKKTRHGTSGDSFFVGICRAVISERRSAEVQNALRQAGGGEELIFVPRQNHKEAEPIRRTSRRGKGHHKLGSEQMHRRLACIGPRVSFLSRPVRKNILSVDVIQQREDVNVDVFRCLSPGTLDKLMWWA